MACRKVTGRPVAGQPCATLLPCHERWLRAPPEVAATLLRPYAGEPMRERVVSTRVNDPRNESEDLLQAT